VREDGGGDTVQLQIDVVRGELVTEQEPAVKVKSLLVAVFVVGLVSAAPLARAADPNVGNWKFNAEKSKGTMFKSGTSLIEAEGEGVKVTVDLTGTDGTPYHWSFSAKYDGKDNPVTGNSPFGNVVSITHDGRTTKVTTKRDGKVALVQTMVVSADGKTRTMTSKGTDAKGNPVASTTVYDRQ
jgi:hypothetical protein